LKSAYAGERLIAGRILRRGDKLISDRSALPDPARNGVT